MSLGPMEIILILAIVLIFFGPKRLPGLGKALGEGIRSFKTGLDDNKTEKSINAASHDDTDATKTNKDS